MADKIEKVFRDLINSLQAGKLYDADHPMFQASVDKSFASFQEAFKDKDELVIGIIGEELVFENEIFFELSKMVKPMITYFKGRGIERLVFRRQLRKEELSKFIALLVSPKEETSASAQERLTLAGITNISAGKLKGGSGVKEEDSSDALSATVLYQGYLDNLSKSVGAMLDESEVDALALRITVANLMDNLVSKYQEFLALTTVKRYDLGTFVHILNVSILSMYFASKIGFNRDDILDIGAAALFHDIGKLSISRKIIKKPDRLTDGEVETIRSHVITGAEILLRYSDKIGPLPVVVCFEHHLKYNLSGYPKLTFPQKPHIASLIVSICDVYDALSQRRSYKNDYPPKMIYDLMMRERGVSFDPQLLDVFFKLMGVWPTGTIVALSDSSVAVVKEQNEDDVFSPKIEVISPPEKIRLLDLRSVKGELSIEHFLNPLKDGKPYLRLI
jgi:putative nucleotidyltransferase with HDIG domain